jgi:hypothetical protein
MPWTGISLFMEVDPDRGQPRIIVFSRESKAAISNLPSSLIVACAKISEPGPEKDIIISRIQLHCTLQVPQGIIPPRLSSIDVPGQFKDSRVIWHGA